MRLRQGTGRGFVLVLLALAMAACLAGCDFGYSFVFENYTDDLLTVSFADSTRRLQPCSVHQYMFLGLSYGTPIDLEICDEEGDSVLTQEIKSLGSQEQPIWVPVGQPGACSCPSPVDSYALTVRNEGSGSIEVWQEDTLLGSVPSGSRMRFGPFPGHWKDIGKFSIHDFRGKTYLISVTSLYVEYKLGELPEIVCSVG